MAKIGRNQSCPCGSGKKHKHCCLLRKKTAAPPRPVENAQVTLSREISKIQQAAAAGRVKLFELGIFIFFSLENRDAWMLDTSEMDAVQVAEKGIPLESLVREDDQTIEIDWSHSFVLQDRKLMLADHEDGAEEELENAPTGRINGALRRIMKQYSPEMLQAVHAV